MHELEFLMFDTYQYFKYLEIIPVPHAAFKVNYNYAKPEGSGIFTASVYCSEKFKNSSNSLHIKYRFGA